MKEAAPPIRLNSELPPEPVVVIPGSEIARQSILEGKLDRVLQQQEQILSRTSVIIGAFNKMQHAFRMLAIACAAFANSRGAMNSLGFHNTWKEARDLFAVVAEWMKTEIREFAHARTAAAAKAAAQPRPAEDLSAPGTTSGETAA